MAEFPKPILCAHLIRVVDTKLLDPLRPLEPAEWDLFTVAQTRSGIGEISSAQSDARKLALSARFRF